MTNPKWEHTTDMRDSAARRETRFVPSKDDFTLLQQNLYLNYKPPIRHKGLCRRPQYPLRVRVEYSEQAKCNICYLIDARERRVTNGIPTTGYIELMWAEIQELQKELEHDSKETVVP